ncbi:MAG: hypothetical protein L6U99_06965 [Clostridium sp.]|nr:MAG: hypothetical protein L6U99_06965 [Clostridium sp.]
MVNIKFLDPILEACEAISYDKCQNPSFELEYWRFTLDRQSKIDKVLYQNKRYEYETIVKKILLDLEKTMVFI